MHPNYTALRQKPFNFDLLLIDTLGGEDFLGSVHQIPYESLMIFMGHKFQKYVMTHKKIRQSAPQHLVYEKSLNFSPKSGHIRPYNHFLGIICPIFF